MSAIASMTVPDSGEDRTTVVAAIVLAAGGGERFGGPRALVRVDGRLLVDRAVEAASAAGCDPVLVVLGMGEEQVRAQAALDGAQVLRNPGWRAGAGSSLRLALEALGDAAGCEAAVLLAVETPGVTAAAVSRLVDAADTKSLRAASYSGRRGYPVLLGRDHWAGVSVLASGDVGERAYLSAHAHELTMLPCEDIADGAEHPPPAA
jgi:CTP:molybdopterin cytidylyltransferase MocA